VDFQTKQAIGVLVEQIADLQDKVARAERAAGTPQLPNSSLTGGGIRAIDEDGTHRGVIGFQTDGTFATVAKNGPPPPAASAPTVTPGPLSLTIAWDGLFAEGDDGNPETQPLDFDHVQVHLSTTTGFTPDAATLQGSLAKPGSLVVTPLSDTTTYYAVLVGVNTSSIVGDPSAEASGVPDPVVATEILDGIVTTLKLADNAVTNAKIANTAVDANKLADGSVSAQKIIDDAITAAKIDDGAVTAAALGPDAVTAGKLADGSIDASTLFAGGVVDTTALDDDAVTADKIAANTIIAGNISAGAIGTTELAANAVVAGKIAANAITAGKIAAGIITATEIATDTITASQIAAGAIGAAELAANSVIAGKIAAGVVDATAIAAGAVTTAKLDALAVTAGKIAANAITAGKIDVGAVTAGTIAAGAVTASTLEATMVVATQMQSTGYVAGTSGWRIGGGSGDAEFNDAEFRGDVTVGLAGSPQVHIYTDVDTGQVDILSGDVAEADPGRLIGGTLDSGPGRSMETTLFGPQTGSYNRPFMAMDSAAADGSRSPLVRFGQATPSFGTDNWLRMDEDSITLNIPAYGPGAGSEGNTANFIGPQPTATTLSWVAYTGSTWSQLPISLTCPPSESMRITISAVMSNRSSAASTIGISVRIRDATTGTNLYVPSSADSLDGASVQATGSVLTANQLSTWVGYAGINLLSGRAGHTMEFLPYYRLSSASGTVSVDGRTSITVECLINTVNDGSL
jgi:hypothetical protein